jgi:hypothetical protein
MSTGTLRTQQQVTNEKLKKPLWEAHAVWTFIVLESGSNATDSDWLMASTEF